MIDVSDLIGKPFAWGGTGPDKWDCVHLCVEVSGRLGINIPKYNTLTSADAIREAIRQGIREEWEKIKQPEVGCWVTMVVDTPWITHVGVVLDDLRHFIHVLENRPVAINRLDAVDWERRIQGYYRYIGDGNDGLSNKK